MACRPLPPGCGICRCCYGTGGKGLRKRSSMQTSKNGLVWLLALTLAAPAQTPTNTFKASSNLVIVNVTVRDKSGKVLNGLKKEDFQVFEDDKPQPVSVFELQTLSTEALPAIEPPAPKLKGEKPQPKKEKEEA